VSKPLIVVESPTKVKTIKKYVGSGYNVAATVGHIKDLPQREIGIDIEDGFAPKYVTVPGKQKVIRALKTAAANADEIFLAPDPDREGEAIAWHTAEVLKKKGRKFHRVLFHELTKKAVLTSLKQSMDLDENKYRAQQTRRILDRLVGYQISPILWKKIKYGLSAGRVQSVAVRMICDRERAIYAFEPEEYWSITALLSGKNPPQFPAKLVKHKGKKISIKNGTESGDIVKTLSVAKYIVEKINKKTIKKNPYPPFTTSKLQQEAIRKLRFSAKKAMSVAQQLYEGVELGAQGAVGLITYMRTDSIRISAEAAGEAQNLIAKRFGPEYALERPRFFKNKNRTQDAHEAIRPTSVFNTPESVTPFLSRDQLALYTLIWKRFVASQMAQALIDQKSILIAAGKYTFSATGSTVRFPGFLTLYQSADDLDAAKGENNKARLPDLETGEALDLIRLEPKQHFTQPPPRYSEASLVKALEENGIGRPSTYANILTTIREKGYVEVVKAYFKPSELGFIVTDLLVENFPDILDVDFTANMENDLDFVEAGKINAQKLLGKFYEVFGKRIETAAEKMQSVKGLGLVSGLDCPECGKKLRIKVGKNGPFLACEGYPECRYTRNYTRDEKGRVTIEEPAVAEAEGQVCEKCGMPMQVRQGKYGGFLSCSGYPECKNTRSLQSNGKGPSTGVKCPEKGCNGEIVEKKSRRGKVFYGCNKYPECSYALWDRPVAEKCPQCDADFMVEKETKREGRILKCLNEACGFKKQVTTE